MVEDIARTSNLVFSHIHLSEIAQWPDTAAARALVIWLDGLPLVWARFSTHIQLDEFEHYVKVLAGCSNPEPVRAFAPGMLSAFETMTARSAVGILETPTLIHAFEKERIEAQISKRMKEVSMEFAETLNATNGTVAALGSSAPKRRKHDADVAYRRRVQLRRDATGAHNRLVAKLDIEYTSRGATLNDVVDPLVDLFQRDPKSLPLTRVLHRLGEGLSQTAASRTVDSRRFGQLDSSLADIFHASIGAAYCSVFTCDQMTATWLGDVRSELGLGPPVVFAGDREGFVSTLKAAWNAARR